MKHVLSKNQVMTLSLAIIGLAMSIPYWTTIKEMMSDPVNLTLLIAFVISMTSFVLVTNGILNPQKLAYNGLRLTASTMYLVMLPAQKEHEFGKVVIASFWLIILVMTLKSLKHTLSPIRIKKGPQTYHVSGSICKKPLLEGNFDTIIIHFREDCIEFKREGQKSQFVHEPKRFRKIVRYQNSIAA